MQAQDEVIGTEREFMDALRTLRVRSGLTAVQAVLTP